VLFHRVHRRCLALLLMGVLLFAQFATAAHACPREADRDEAPVAAHMPGCPGGPGHGATPVDEPAPVPLCKAHCDQGNQNVTPQNLPDLSTSPLLLTVLDWTEGRLAPALPAGRAPLATSGAPPGAPPLYLALLVLRN
jgi:hypothetical protein